jgi:hypothetical protein
MANVVFWWIVCCKDIFLPLGWPILYQQQLEHSIQKRSKLSGLPHVDDDALNICVKFTESNLGRETRMESSLIRSNTKVQQKTPQHGQLIASSPSAEALRHGKDALIATKASLYISHKHCQW